MAERKVFLGEPAKHPELEQLLAEATKHPVTDEQLREQRVSFAFGNAPEGSRITKESVRAASESMSISRR